MVSMPAWSRNALPLAAASLLLASCSRATPVQPPAQGPSVQARAQDDEVAIEGSYTCEFHKGSEALVGTCYVEQSAEGLRLRMELGPHRLQGALTRTDYGFRLQGRFDQATVESDFMHQGGKSFAAVLQLADQSLCKINMAP